MNKKIKTKKQLLEEIDHWIQNVELCTSLFEDDLKSQSEQNEASLTEEQIQNIVIKILENPQECSPLSNLYKVSVPDFSYIAQMFSIKLKKLRTIINDSELPSFVDTSSFDYVIFIPKDGCKDLRVLLVKRDQKNGNPLKALTLFVCYENFFTPKEFSKKLGITQSAVLQGLRRGKIQDAYKEQNIWNISEYTLFAKERCICHIYLIKNFIVPEKVPCDNSLWELWDILKKNNVKAIQIEKSPINKKNDNFMNESDTCKIIIYNFSLQPFETIMGSRADIENLEIFLISQKGIGNINYPYLLFLKYFVETIDYDSIDYKSMITNDIFE